MKRQELTETLKNLRNEDRFDLFYGPRREEIEYTLGCKILTLPIDQLEHLSPVQEFYLVTDRYKGNSYVALLQLKEELINETP
jgi:hypothetical protein